MGSREWRAAVVGMALGVALVVPAFAAPAGAAETTFTDTCDEVYGRKPVGDLEKTTDPVAGSEISSGETVSITVSWPNQMVAGDRAHRLLECLSVDGGAPRQWTERTFTTAEGTATLSAVVPSGLTEKNTVCSQSFLKTAGTFGPVTRWSEKTCFPVGPAGSIHALSRIKSPPAERETQPENRSTPTTRGPLFSSPSPPSSSKPYSPPSGSGDYEAPWPPWEKAPRVAAAPPVTTPTTLKASTVPTRKAQGNQVAAPAGQAAVRQPSQTLPRTGAGVVVLVAIAAVVLFSGRTLRKTAQHIEDNLPVEALPVDDDEEPTLVLGRRW